MKPQVLAYYLPAFHEIPENNAWYGEGFTEWDNTKKGNILFKGHYQPRQPQGDNYYDLSDVKALEWQCDLAKKNGIDGFCFYHYWFNGRLILEKPVANFLESKNTDIKFCFAWANEPWRKTWHDGIGESELLIDQSYGDQQDWIDHYNYFRNYFLDERYIKVNNKPMLLIYRINSIPDFLNKFSIWQEMAKSDGFDGIHIVNMITKDSDEENKKYYKSVFFEPTYTLSTHNMYALSLWRIRRVFYNKFIKKSQFCNNFFDTVNYNKFYKSLWKNQKKHRKDCYLSCFCDWDNSPRKGKRGVIMRGASPNTFKKNFKKIYDLCDNLNDEYKCLFLFAWNEWGEGGYLEPDKKFGNGYLTAIKNIVCERS